MTALEQINSIERKLHAAKGSVKALKNKRWIDLNYKGTPTPSDEIEQTEREITEHRKALIQLYQTI